MTVEELTTTVSRYLGDLVGLSGTGSAAPREEAFTAWRRLFEGMAEQHPLVLVFDDLQWADADSLARAVEGCDAVINLAHGSFYTYFSSKQDVFLAVVRDVQLRSQLEYPLGRVLYQTAGWISHARVSPDGAIVVVTNRTDNTVSPPTSPTSCGR